MVALAVRFLGQPPIVCNARPLLHKAAAAVERGQWIEAGVCLREAVRTFLLADCTYYNVPVSKRKVRQTPRALLEALERAGHCDEFCLEQLSGAIDLGNRAAHLQFVRPRELADAICTLHFILDQARFLIQPTAAGRLS